MCSCAGQRDTKDSIPTIGSGGVDIHPRTIGMKLFCEQAPHKMSFTKMLWTEARESCQPQKAQMLPLKSWSERAPQNYQQQNTSNSLLEKVYPSVKTLGPWEASVIAALALQILCSTYPQAPLLLLSFHFILQSLIYESIFLTSLVVSQFVSCLCICRSSSGLSSE